MKKKNHTRDRLTVLVGYLRSHHSRNLKSRLNEFEERFEDFPLLKTTLSQEFCHREEA